tara:strand:+ start:1329 stop:1517 length:189 start_codon:yes stop_codon:yes gene_type:complete
MVAKNIMKGSSSKIRAGMNESDKINGIEKDTPKSLKNSISSNKFKIIPRHKNTNRKFNTIFK